MTRLAALTLPVALGLAAASMGRPPAAPVPPAGNYIPDRDLGGRCLTCHSVGPNEFTRGSADFVLLYESVYWKNHDLHSRAFAALESDLGRQIGERLPGKPDVTKHAACLVCHATDHKPGSSLADNPADRFGCALGVNCQACHGPGDGWNGKHQGEEWRKTPPADKAKLGLADLRDPAVRAERCVSCHVGSVAEHKFVTHEMYAAGHPPLPAFELATFSRDEPQHWRPAAAVSPITGLAPSTARELFHYRAGEVEAARLAAVGAVTALRETARLAAAAPAAAPLDFAHFNCAACHHELVVPSDRQRNGFPGVAGRPVPTTWPAWAVRAVLRRDDLKAEATGFETAYAGWRRAFDAAPFGQPADVATAAAGLETACQAILAKLDATTFDGKAANALVEALAAQADTPAGGRRDYLDPDAAGLLARAAVAIRSELDNSAAGRPTGAQPPPPPPFTGPSARLHDLVRLSVREVDDNKSLLHARGTYTARAKRAFDYRAADFRSAFAEFAHPRP